LSSASTRNRILPRLLAALLVISLGAYACAQKKQESAPAKQASSYDLTGEWRSDIQSADRVITKSVYRIEQKADSVSLRLVSTKSPTGDELVPQGMRLDGSGAWSAGAVRFAVTSWVSGKDTCTFLVKGEMDPAGKFLLHFPGDICGDKSLPYTRELIKADSAATR
jgi:hypothetical protein